MDNTGTNVNSEQNSLVFDQAVDNVNNGNDTSEPDQILVKKKTSISLTVLRRSNSKENQ